MNNYTPVIIFIVLLAGLTVAMIYNYRAEMKAQRVEEANATIKLNRLLKYRDKAKLLDEYMNTSMPKNVLTARYHKIKDKQ